MSTQPFNRTIPGINGPVDLDKFYTTGTYYGDPQTDQAQVAVLQTIPSNQDEALAAAIREEARTNPALRAKLERDLAEASKRDPFLRSDINTAIRERAESDPQFAEQFRRALSMMGASEGSNMVILAAVIVGAALLIKKGGF